MCLPAIAAFAAANAGTISLVSGAVGALGSYQSAQAAKSAAKYQASVDNANAKVAEFKAQDAQDRAQVEAENLGRRVASVRGKQKATLAANGLDLGSGSAQAILDATDFYGAEDQNTLVNNGGRESWSLRTQASNFRTDAQMQKSKADNISPFGAVATSLLGTASSLADKWSVKNPSSKSSPWSWAVGPQ